MADGNYDALISGSELNERWRSMLTRYIKKQCGDDEELFKNILPDYPPYCSRVLVDNDWVQTLKRDNVNLIPFKGILYAGSHMIHHYPWGENYNLGKITSVCDRLYGSYCDPEGITGYGY